MAEERGVPQWPPAIASMQLGWLVAAVLVSASGCGTPATDAAADREAGPRGRIGKTTQQVLDLATAKAGGGVPVDPGAERVGLDVITGAQRAVAGQVSILAVEQKLKLYEVERGSRPRTHAEFMRHIIASGSADELRLPLLPSDQDYAFDPEHGCLVVVEFPARRQEATTKAR